MDHADGRQTRMRYNGFNELDQVTDSNGVTGYSYDTRGRLLSVSQPGMPTIGGISTNPSIRYTYDAVGNRTRVETAAQVNTFSFDLRGRMTQHSATHPSGVSNTHFQYDGNGVRTGMTQANGTTVSYQYNARNQLTSLLHRSAAGVLLLGMSYTLDASGMRVSIEESNAQGITRTTSYQYDVLKRLTQESVVAANSAHNRTTSWTYDATGNRLSQTQTGSGAPNGGQTTSYRYDANDRLLEEVSGSELTRITWDSNGNQIESVTTNGGSSETRRLSWDSDNRLTQQRVTTSAGLADVTRFYYNHNGIRTAKATAFETPQTVITRFHVDENRDYAQVLEEHVQPSGTVSSLSKTYLYADDLLALVGSPSSAPSTPGTGKTGLVAIDNDVVFPANASNVVIPAKAGIQSFPANLDNAATKTSDGSKPDTTPVPSNNQPIVRYFHYDGLGSTRLLSDQTGTITDQYVYHAFGELDAPASTTTTDQNYRYTGEQLDPNLGFYYLRARYMDPSRGGFVSQDTYMGRINDPATLHKYAYVHQSPTMGIDPSGRSFVATMASLASSLSRVAIRLHGIAVAYEKINSVLGFVQLIVELKSVLGGALPLPSPSYSGWSIPNVDYADAALKLAINMPKAIGTGLVDWSDGYAVSHKRGEKLKGFLIYMPTPMTTPTPVSEVVVKKIQFGNKRVPLKLVFGSTQGSGQLFGIGVDMTKNRQLVRMDYHKWNTGHGGANKVKGGEISVWRDDPFHFHVLKWHQ